MMLKKKLKRFGICVFIAIFAFAPTVLADTSTRDAGTLAGGTTACSNTGGAWGNPTSAQTSNGGYATFGGAFFDNNEVSDALELSNFGFSLPANSTINGIIVDIEAYSPDGAGTGEITLVQLTKVAGTGTGNDLESGANAMEGADPDSYPDSYGSATELWGTTWSEAEVEDPGFGVVLCFTSNGANRDISVDHIRITVDYTPPSPPTVTTNTESGVGETSATLEGEITATGGANVTVRGFAWGTSSTLSNGDTSTSTDTVGQPFSTGTFSQPVFNLLSNTTYYYRAYATNANGTGYGSTIESFVTGIDNAPRRMLRLFEGYILKLLNGARLIIHQQ